MARLKTYIEGDKLNAEIAFNEFFNHLGKQANFQGSDFTVVGAQRDKKRERQATPSGDRTIERITVTLEITRVMK